MASETVCRAPVGSALAVFTDKGVAVWLVVWLVGIPIFAVAGLPLSYFAAVVTVAFVILLWRALFVTLRIRHHGVLVRNGLRTYAVPTSCVVGSSVYQVRKVPPRLALKVEVNGAAKVIAVDATARFTASGRRKLVQSLGDQDVIGPLVLRAFSDFTW